jgi:3-oxoacyl-[acyl-carrier protein] reductase
MSKPLAGKVALVTGGSRGIGASIVRRLASDGAAVCFTFAASQDQALAQAVNDSGGEALPLKADSADTAAVQDAVTRTAERFDRLDILVNNAGILVRGLVDDYPLSDFDRMLAVNVRAVFVAIQAAVPHMKPGGITVNTVQPGPTEIDINADETMRNMIRPLMAIGRMGKDSEVASLVAYLAGPESSFITGAALTIDGGYLA